MLVSNVIVHTVRGAVKLRSVLVYLFLYSTWNHLLVQ
jgi:hypothetical protein